MMFFERLKKNGFSIAITVLFLAALILLNVFVSMLTGRFFLKIDLTETGLYTLSERAAEYLSGIDERVDLIVLEEESIWRTSNTYSIIMNVLDNYSASSGGYIRVSYVNPDLNSFNGPEYDNSLTVLKEAYSELENMSRNDIIFLSSRRATRVAAYELFTQSSDMYGRATLSGVRADQELISALTYVLNEDIARITFIENHGESRMENLNYAFERSGYRSSSINLSIDEIPEGTTVLVAATPQFDYSSYEIEKLEQYLGGGGNFMFLYDSDLFNMQMLSNFLAEWGIVVENKLIFDEDYTFVPQYGVIGAYIEAGDLPSTEDAFMITTNIMPMGVFLARPIISENPGSNLTFSPLVRTISSSSYAKDIGGGSITTSERERGDDIGPFTVAYSVRRLTRDADGKQVYSNFIIAPATMFDDSFLSLFGDSFYNSMLMIDLANDFNPFSGRVYIPSKGLASSQMLVSASGARTILIIMVIALPLAIIATGVVVWRKRRHK